MIGIPIGLAYANAAEWLIHKYVLHGSGKKKGTFWSFHFHEHHKASRKNGFIDEVYVRPGIRWDPKGKELLGLVALTSTHLPLFPVAPFFTTSLVYSAYNYYVTHKRAHLDPAWAAENLPWHVEHHMGRNQDANWCVTKPFFDYVMGTRLDERGQKRDLELAGMLVKLVRRQPLWQGA